MVNEGDKAPAIDINATDGTSVNLASPGQPLVLYFYPKDDTSGCTREAQDFTALAGDFKKAGVKVVGVSRDPMKSHAKFIGKYGLAVPRIRRGRQDLGGIRHLGPKIDVRPQIYGDGAGDLFDRCRRTGSEGVAQSQSAEARRGSAQGGDRLSSPAIARVPEPGGVPGRSEPPPVYAVAGPWLSPANLTPREPE